MKISQHEGTCKDLEGQRRLVTGPHLKDDRFLLRKFNLIVPFRVTFDLAVQGLLHPRFTMLVVDTVIMAASLLF